MKRNFLKFSIAGLIALNQFALPLTVNYCVNESSVVAHAAEVVASGNCGTEGHESGLTWSLDRNGTLTVSGNGRMGECGYNGEEAPWHDCKSQITEVIIENGVTSIARSAFSYFENLEKIVIPNTVTDIEYGAFFYCTSLTSVSLPDGITNIGNSAFMDCESIIEVDIPDSVTSIGDSAFAGCTSLTSISIPNNITDIGGAAFSGTPWLETQKKDNPMVIVNGVLIDGFGCSGDIVIPEQVKVIGSCAFWSNNDLTSVSLSDSVTSIERQAFYYCENLTYVKTSNKLINIGNEAFYCCDNLNDFIMPDTVTSIGVQAFNGCHKLENITISKKLTDFGWGAFYGTAWLEARQKENSIVIINNVLLDGETCSGVVDISDGVIKIADRAFYNADVTAVNIPNSVTSIGNEAFLFCHVLNSVIVESDTPLTVGSDFLGFPNVTKPSYPDDTYFNPSNMQIFVPSDSVEEYKKAEGWSIYADKIFAKSAEVSVTTPPSEPPITSDIKKGNLDNNSNIDVTDLTMLSLYLIGDQKFTDEQIKAADIDGDGEVTLADLARLRQFLSKKIDKLDAE